MFLLFSISFSLKSGRDINQKENIKFFFKLSVDIYGNKN